ncbi:MAG: hypothetical protein Roseis2KO_33560 [Roseivirga sp.]
MAKSRTFGGVTTAVWQCLKTTSEKEHGTIYAPAGADQGTATTDTVVGTVELSYNYDAQKDSVTYKVVKKPFIVSDSQIWNGIQDTIDHCSS